MTYPGPIPNEPTTPQPQYPPYPGMTLPVDPQRDKTRNRNKQILLIAGFVVTFLAGIGIGSAGAGNSAADASLAAPAPEVTITQQVPGPTVTAAAPAAVAKPTPTSPPAKPAIPTAIGDGTWQVGVDMQAGTYVGTVPADSIACYWERDKDASGSFNSILANDNLNPGAHVALAVTKTTKYVTLSGCGTLHKR